MYIIAEIASDRILPKIKNNINEIGQTKFSIGLIIFLIVLNIVSIFITVDYYSSFNYQVLTLFKLTEVPWFVVNAYSSILIPIVLYDYFRNGTTKISIMGWNKYTISFTLVIIVTFIIVLQNFNRSFAVPNNLKNVNLIINSNTKIVYFNDQYIFLEIKKEDKIKVLKFDDFFEENKAAD